MRKTSKTFELIPSVQIREDIPAPMAFIPALPVRLQNQDGTEQYAIVDTTAEVSIMPFSIARALGLEKETIGSKIMIKGIGGKFSCELIKTTLIICDLEFSNWLRLENVPFAIIPDTEQLPRPDRLILGYDSCLANLQLIIDFTRGTICVSAPVRFLASNSPWTQGGIPSRITEAERLINEGSYDSAMALISMELEETITLYLSTVPKCRTLLELSKLLSKEGLEPEYQKQLQILTKLRNRAMHFHTEPITEKEATDALQYSRTLIRHLYSLKSTNEIIENGENEFIEFKSSLRWDYRVGRVNKDREYDIAKIITSFLNTKGGVLLIGVSDNGEILGLYNDFSTLKKKNMDGFELQLGAIIKKFIGNEFYENIYTAFEQIDGKIVCKLIINPAKRPAFLDKKEFYIRTGNSSIPLVMLKAKEYIDMQWKK